MKKLTFTYIFLISFLILLLTACGNKEEDWIIPFSPIVPGMTMEEIKQLEPSTRDVSSSFGEGVHDIEKEYNGALIYNVLYPKSMKDSIIWSNTSDLGTSKADKLVLEFKEYCNERYELTEEASDADMRIIQWTSEKYIIKLIDFTQEYKRIVSFSITNK